MSNTPSSLESLRRLPGFVGGLALILLSGWALHFLGYSFVRRLGGNQELNELIGFTLTFTISFGLFIVMERHFWLSRLMGLKHGRSHVIEAGLFWLFGIVWAFVRAAGAEPEDENGSKPASEKQPPQPRDPARESVETIVFVVVLVLLLKLFVTEAFVIPTGSMAETLYGYQKIVTCPKCALEFPVNSHDEVEPGQDGEMRALVGFCCPNCRYNGRFGPDDPRPPNRTGDRVLVLKPLYHLTNPNRGDVVVFKFPDTPQVKHTAQNYIKRAMGFGGETVGIHRGELFTTTALDYPADKIGELDETDDLGNRRQGLLFPRPDDPLELWRPQYMYPNNKAAIDLFEKSRAAGFLETVPGGFQIIRKPDEQMLADRRIVWDNDKQPEELARRGVPSRWYAPKEFADKWTSDDPAKPRTFAHTASDLQWIRYRHLIGAWEGKLEPRPIDNFLGYNAGVERDSGGREASRSGAENFWVGDLVLECEATLGDDAEVVMELSKGTSRFQATFAGGQVTLTRTGPNAGTIASRPCKVRGSGKYQLRFANVDCRLRVWIDGRAIDFGNDADYPATEASQTDPNDRQGEGWYAQNDIDAPASIGAKGAVTVQHIQLHRDIYYTHGQSGQYLYYVQPGHYMCLGDNSAQSSDSRTWGAVPERLLLGKAVFVFFPLDRIGFIK